MLRAIYSCKVRLVIKNQPDSEVASSDRNMSQRNLILDVRLVKH